VKPASTLHGYDLAVVRVLGRQAFRLGSGRQIPWVSDVASEPVRRRDEIDAALIAHANHLVVHQLQHGGQ
jgi:hypothetical protein